MKENESVRDYTDRVEEVVQKLKTYGDDIKDERVVEKILTTLVSRFEPKVTAIEESKDLSTLTVTELVGSLKAYEDRQNKIADSFSSEHAFKVKQFSIVKGENKRKVLKNDSASVQTEKKEGKFFPCKFCGKTNHLEQFCWKNVQYNNCKKMGHIPKFCKAKKK